MKKNLLVILLISCWFSAQGQKENNIWCFGAGAGLNFNSGQPVATPLNSMNAQEGCASIADNNGNLLFYTNGETIWHKNHAHMHNGQTIQGKSGAAQSSFIVPKPGTPGRYYVFTVDPTIRALVTGLKYNEVDMTAQNGLGSVVQKNISLEPNTTEHLTAIRHQNMQDVWVVVVDQNYQNLAAYLVTPTGVSIVPVTSPVNFQVSLPKPVKGCMKFSPNGLKLALNIGKQGTLVYDFNASTGQFSNPFQITPNNINLPTYGVEFSPNSRFLYVSNLFNIQQYDLAAGSQQAINLSAYTVIVNYAGSLQLATNGKIYASLTQNEYGEINNPDLPQANAYFVVRHLINNAFSTKGLPQFLKAASVPPSIQHSNPCSSDSMAFSLMDITNPDSVHWVFGDPVSGPADSSRSLTPKHLFSSPGNFTVTATVYANGISQVLTKIVSVAVIPRVLIMPRDSLVCNDRQVRLVNTYPPNTGADSYEWYQNGVQLQNNTIAHTAATTGWYKLRVISGSCSVSDSVYIRFHKVPEVGFQPITKVCADDFKPVLLRATSEGASYKWQDGSTDSVYLATKPGTYTVEVAAGPCRKVFSTTVAFHKPVEFSLGPKEIEVCERSYRLKSPFNSTTWSTGEKGKEIVVTESGTYSGTISGVDCPVTDSIKITFLWCVTQGDIPNIITPNGDGQNQKFFIENLEPGVWSIDIFNRWGNRVYRKETYDNSWEAKGLSDGVYYYLMQNRRSGQVVKGWVEVVR